MSNQSFDLPGLRESTTSDTPPTSLEVAPEPVDCLQSSCTVPSPVMTLQGNILFWTSADPRETTIWGNEAVCDVYEGTQIQRKIEYFVTTPPGYSVQTKTFIRSNHDGPSAEFWWATLTQLGLCVLKNSQIPMAHFLRKGSTPNCSRFYIPEDGRCFEWCRSTHQSLAFTLYEVPSGIAFAEFIGGPFESDELYPYMQYYWSQDDALLLFAILSITVRRWMDIHNV